MVIELICDSAIPLPGIYPRKLKAESQKSICTPIFIPALLTTVKNRYKYLGFIDG
jgi:hypothetical protein